jgi:N-ethylmaleimide reductase
MTASEINLFTPVKLGPYTLKNRMVMAPLTRNRSTETYSPQAMNVTYYKQRSSAGLIITEASQISPQGLGYPLTPGIYSNEQVVEWKKVTDAVHENGGHIFLQLWHVGRISHPSLQIDNQLPVAPSAIKPEGEAFTYSGLQPFVEPHALETGEIADIINNYKHAAECALKAGFDGVEVHAANGYLIDQFLRDGSNQRGDEYGGSLENRSRFLLQVLDAVIDVWGSDRVGIRLSPLNSFNSMHDSNPEALFSYVVERLNPLKLAYLHVVEGSILTPVNNDTAFDLKILSNLYDGVYMANSGYTKQTANNALASEHAALVSFGSLYLANPDLVERFKHDTELNTPDQATFYGGDEKGYTDYPFLEASVDTAQA